MRDSTNVQQLRTDLEAFVASIERTFCNIARQGDAANLFVAIATDLLLALANHSATPTGDLHIVLENLAYNLYTYFGEPNTF